MQELDRGRPGFRAAGSVFVQVTGSQEVIYWHEFQYDDVGNMVKKLDLTTTPATVLAEFEHNAADQITNTGFSYDDRGNMVEESRPESEEDWDYTYDSQNRLLTASDGTNNYAYEYDGDGNRVKQAKKDGGAVVVGGVQRAAGRARAVVPILSPTVSTITTIRRAVVGVSGASGEAVQ